MSRAGPMSWGRRYDAYTAQRGSWRLTPRQERRYLRKANRAGDAWSAYSHMERMTERDCESHP